MAPKIIFGTASFGMDLTEFQDVESVRALLSTLRDLNISHLDSGARYPPLNPGRAEQLIGEAKELSSHFLADTKVFTDTRNDGSGDLTRSAVASSANDSLDRLRRAEGTPLEEHIQGSNEQIAQGHWVSNTSPETLEQILRLCEQNGWVKPLCYQGEYSLISRGMETRLLPILRAHGMTFNAFRGLASGFLTGNFVNDRKSGTRFGDENPLGKAVQRIFGAEDLTRATKIFDAEVRAHGLSPVEVAAHWLSHHSELTEEDGLVLGASKRSQIIETVSLIQKGPLPAAVLDLTDNLWTVLKETRGNII
ncbi:putative oxidoreductase [Durotheca rogersii]|uniref:putative oxidoreductase n=1 Tax=Durotheca rogersii TaxID=419775 RepID=UPI0022203A2A|nr:putative oxidoreductase [Durotheca rogersii]KAI5860761.1 putative oxidoreductase [Durotheca rogersii]